MRSPRDDPDGDWTPLYAGGDPLLRPRPCRWCRAPVRLADFQGRVQYQLRTEPQPVDPATVRDQTWPAWWWSDAWGLVSRVKGYDDRHLDQDLYVMHPCESLAHRPGTAPPSAPAPPPQQERAPAQMTAPTFETFTPPVFEDGDSYSPKDHIGAVVIVKVRERKEGVVTPNTPAPGGPAVIVDLVDLTDGAVYRNVLLMGGAFVDAMTPYVSKGPIVVQIASRTGKSGRAYSAPDPANPEQIALAGSYYAAKGDPFAQTFATVAPDAAPAATPAAAPAATPAASTAPPWA